jgi:hypothetical protein
MPEAERWLLLIVKLPSHPSSVRVRAWRKLRALGAVALKNSVYVLPFTAEIYEQLQWLAQEVQKDGGDATLVSVDRIENVKPEELIRLFQAARNADYASLAERYRRLAKVVDRSRKGAGVGRRAEELRRLAREADRVREIDFFHASGRREVDRLHEIVEMRLRGSPGAPPTPARGTVLAGLRGRRWCTRPRPHVDRIASAWLIKRFVDPDAEFVFAPPEELPPGAIPFDVAGADLGHQGEDCTFETLLRRTGLRDRRLAELAEVVHEADLRDQKFRRDEARGIDLAIRALLAAIKEDHAVLAHGLTLFDGLYAVLGEKR